MYAHESVTERQENGFARAFGAAGGMHECRGDAPPDPPSVGDVTGPFTLSCFLQEKFFGEARTVKVMYKKPHKTKTNKWRA